MNMKISKNTETIKAKWGLKEFLIRNEPQAKQILYWVNEPKLNNSISIRL